MAQGPSDTILVAIRIMLWIRESKVRNPDHPDRRRFVLCECILVLSIFIMILTGDWSVHILIGPNVLLLCIFYLM